jgi:hypothetical protein
MPLRSDDCIMVIYTYDFLIFACHDNVIDQLIKSLSTTYLLEDHGSFNDYLGICINKDSAYQTTHMAQPGLIESILHDLNLLHDSKTKDTSALGILHPDHYGHPCQETWNYRSVIDKLNYLAQNTRLDISFAVHQCTHFSS